MQKFVGTVDPLETS